MIVLRALWVEHFARPRGRFRRMARNITPAAAKGLRVDGELPLWIRLKEDVLWGSGRQDSLVADLLGECVRSLIAPDRMDRFPGALVAETSATPGGFAPDGIRSAYRLSPDGGAGQLMAIVTRMATPRPRPTWPSVASSAARDPASGLSHACRSGGTGSPRRVIRGNSPVEVEDRTGAFRPHEVLVRATVLQASIPTASRSIHCDAQFGVCPSMRAAREATLKSVTSMGRSPCKLRYAQCLPYVRCAITCPCQ